MADGDRNTQVTNWHAANRLRDDIMSGLRDGDKIEAEEELAARYGVARNTMRKAIAQLRAEGILVSVHGRGTFAAAVPRRSEITVRAGDRLRAWLPDEDERAAFRLPPGVPVLRVTRSGGAVEHYDASRTDVIGPSSVLAEEGPARPAMD
jgi:GntR family transcriptional regulator